MIIEDPPGFSIHESATVSTVWPMMPCYSNLVLFDQLKPHETPETVVPELAERWSWQDNHRNLVFFLEIQRKLEADVARPMLGWRKEYFTQWSHVKNLVPHHSLYNWGRMQEVWLDK